MSNNNYDQKHLSTSQRIHIENGLYDGLSFAAIARKIEKHPSDIALLDELISPLLKKGQSLAHIYAFHRHEIPCSRKTLYNYIDQGVFTARNIDMRRKVRYKCKPQKKVQESA